MTTGPTITFEKRHAEAEWQLDATHYVVLSVRHFPERRAFSAMLRREVKEDYGPGISMRSFAMYGDTESVGAERVARYSDRALREFFDRMLELVTERRAAGAYADLFAAPQGVTA